MKIELVKFTNNHLEDLVKISRQTFAETFAEQNSKENLDQYLSNNLTLKSLSEETQNIDSEFYFALVEEKIAGYLKLNVKTAQTELKEEEGLEIERIYVLSEFLGAGVGKVLFEKSLEIAQKNDKNYVWLGVWENNPRAIKFYEKNGFKIFGEHPFLFGDEIQKDLLMKLNLN